jgi:hypothetical protein
MTSMQNLFEKIEAGQRFSVQISPVSKPESFRSTVDSAVFSVNTFAEGEGERLSQRSEFTSEVSAVSEGTALQFLHG